MNKTKTVLLLLTVFILLFPTLAGAKEINTQLTLKDDFNIIQLETNEKGEYWIKSDTPYIIKVDSAFYISCHNTEEYFRGDNFYCYYNVKQGSEITIFNINYIKSLIK